MIISVYYDYMITHKKQNIEKFGHTTYGVNK